MGTENSQSSDLKMSDNAESPTEPPKEEPQSPPDDSTANEEKKKSVKALFIDISSI